MKLTDEQRQRVVNAMKNCIDEIGYCDCRALTAAMRELAGIYATEITPETSDLRDVVCGLLMAADDLEAK